MLKATALMVLFVALSLHAQDIRQPASTDAAHVAEQRNGDQPGTRARPLVVQVEQTQESNQEANARKEKEREDASAKHREFILTVIVALAAVVQAIAVFGQIVIYIRQTNIMESNLKAANSTLESDELQVELAERPWLSVKAHISGPLTFTHDGAWVQVVLEMKNHGRTPALGVSIDPAVHILSVSKPHPFEALKRQCEESLAREGTSGEIIFPGGIFAQNHSIQAAARQIEEGYIGGNPIFSMALTVCVSYRATFKAAARYYTGVNYDLWKHDPNVPGHYVFTVGEEVPQENFRTALSILIGTVVK
jgi:cell division protein FtsL